MPIHFPTRYITYDTETTGLNPSHDEVVELSAMKVDGDHVEARTWLLKPSVPMSEEASRINGITQEELDRDGRDPYYVWNEFAEFIGIMKYDGNTKEFIAIQPVENLPLVGHNITRFDNKFVIRAFSRYLKVESFPMMNSIDTAAMYKGRLLGMPQMEGESHFSYARRVLSVYAKGLKYKLTEVFAQEGGTLSEGMTAHRAATDVYMTDFIYRKMAKLDQEPYGKLGPMETITLKEKPHIPFNQDINS